MRGSDHGRAAPSHRNLGLDLLRVVAVLLVLGRHMWAAPANCLRPVRWFFDAWSFGGWVGVDLFFVLSGFLVSGLLFAEYRKRGEISILRFYARRGWKIYPAFYCLIAVTTLMRIRYHNPLSSRNLVSELFFLQNYLSPMWNHTWSLAVEEHFYLMLPVLLGGLVWLRKGSFDPFRPLLPIIAFTCVALLVLRCYNTLIHEKYTHKTHLFPTHLRLDSLFFGVAIAYSYHFQGEWFRRVFGARRRWLMVGGCLALAPAFVFPLGEGSFLHTVGLTLFYPTFRTSRPHYL